MKLRKRLSGKLTQSQTIKILLDGSERIARGLYVLISLWPDEETQDAQLTQSLLDQATVIQRLEIATRLEADDLYYTALKAMVHSPHLRM